MDDGRRVRNKRKLWKAVGEKLEQALAGSLAITAVMPGK